MVLLKKKLQEAIDRINAWGKINGFIISSQKSVAIHFCKSRGLHPYPKLKLNNQTIPFVSEVKFLGLILDKKLTFKSHLNHLKRKCTLPMNIVKILSSSWYGAESSSFLKIYRALIRSKLDYGSAVYGSASKSTLQPLDTIHNQGLHLTVGAFRTSPILSLYTLCNEPSLELRRERLALNLFFEIKSDNSHPSHYNVINSKYSTLFSFRPSFTPTFGFRIGKILRSLNTVDYPVLNKSNEFPPWKDINVSFIDVFEKWHKLTTLNLVYQSMFYDHRQQFSGYEPVFTDVSKADNLVSMVLVIRNSIVSGLLHEFCSVFTSEIYAIYSALVKIADGDYKKMIVYSDSKSAIEALRSFSPLSHPIVLECVEFYLYLTGKGLNIMFCWIPGHSGIIANEMADKAARRHAIVVDNFVPCVMLCKSSKIN
ncbi:hypothetical protein AVEN_137120-1 [Araneus ventricosus]|uniref:RNase H type-1 domain-containing protein n=1 Tax=Araneus ventricosus TaxID=182803 RepID=A0A4Y2GDK9_ARAVE|nr:hypothetical protein AVEN_137120-1 [Araneus ventricosus]